MAQPAVAEVGQDDFSSGMWRSVARHKIPRNGAYDIRDGLLDDDGTVYRRGPVSRLSAQILTGGAVQVQSLWDVSLSVGRRTLFAGVGFFGFLVGAASTVHAGTSSATPGPMAKLGDIAFIPGDSTSGGLIYGGSLKILTYALGTITTVAGSAVVTGVGTAWLANVDAGMLLARGIRAYVVKSVDSNTQITLTTPIEVGDGGAGLGYTLAPVITMSTVTNAIPLGAVGSALGPAVAAVANKLWISDGKRRVYQTAGPDPLTGRVRPFEFTWATNYHEFPSTVVALAGLRDRLFVFCEDGLYVVSGCAYNIVDSSGNPQQRVEKVSDEVVARTASGVCVGSDFIVVAARDGAYMVDSLGSVTSLTRSISTYWQAAMQAGSTAGMPAVYRGHLFVSLGGEVLVCRLDRPQKSRLGIVFPWSRATGYLGLCKSFAVADPTGATKLLAGSNDRYVLDATGIFAAGSADGDGTTHQLLVETGEIELDGETQVRTVRLDYDATSPLTNVAVVEWSRAGGVYTALAAHAPVSAADRPFTWRLDRACRRLSVRFTSEGATITEFRVRGWRAAYRPQGRRR